jgi:hypothetical protein
VVRFENAAVKKLFAALLLAPVFASAAGWAPSVTTTATWQSNVTNADVSADILSAFQLHANLSSSQRFSLGHDDALIVGAQLEAETWLHYSGLNRAALGPTLAWTHKFGLGPFAPILSLELAASDVGLRESERSGIAGSAALAWRQRLDEATRFALGYERTRYDARDALYDRTGEEGSASVTRDLAAEWSVSATVRYRRGDVLAYASPPRNDLVALSRDRDPNTTFGRNFIAYSLEAHTASAALALNRTLNDSTALTFGYEYRDTTRRPVRYVNHLVSVALTRQF